MGVRFGHWYPLSLQCENHNPDSSMLMPSILVEDVLLLLEAADIPEKINDKIVELIESWEKNKRQQDMMAGGN